MGSEAIAELFRGLACCARKEIIILTKHHSCIPEHRNFKKIVPHWKERDNFSF